MAALYIVFLLTGLALTFGQQDTGSGHTDTSDGVAECTVPDIENGVYIMEVNGEEQIVLSGAITQADDVITLRCDTGYSQSPVQGNTTSSCTSSGDWLPQPTATCAKISGCNTFPNVPNGQFLGAGPFVAGYSLSLRCEPGYGIKGRSFITCLKNFTWTAPGSCAPLSCSNELPEISNGVFDGGLLVFGSNRSVLCNTGYHLRPEAAAQITCQANKKWSMPSENSCVLGENYATTLAAVMTSATRRLVRTTPSATIVQAKRQLANALQRNNLTEIQLLYERIAGTGIPFDWVNGRQSCDSMCSQYCYYLSGSMSALELVRSYVSQPFQVEAMTWKVYRPAVNCILQRLSLEYGQAMLEAGRNGRFDVANSKDRDGFTALMFVTEIGRSDMASKLIENGADVNAQTPDYGLTPLIVSVWNATKTGSSWMQELVADGDGITGLLLDNGATIELTDKAGWTALKWAAYRNNTAAFDTLIEYGANRASACPSGSTLWICNRQ